jgi:hypothetical protein
MAADALERQIESVGNTPVEPPGHVDGQFAIGLVPGKDHHAADRGADRPGASFSSSESCSVIRFSAGHLVKVCITESLDKKNSPKLELWCRYTPGVVSDRSKRAPLGSGFLHMSRW